MLILLCAPMAEMDHNARSYKQDVSFQACQGGAHIMMQVRDALMWDPAPALELHLMSTFSAFVWLSEPP